MSGSLRSLLAFAILGSLALGCGGGDGSGPNENPVTPDMGTGVEPQSVMLAQVEGEAPDAACANGGVIVAFGVDTNANGELDDDEVSRREAVCNGENGRDAIACQIVDNDDGSAYYKTHDNFFVYGMISMLLNPIPPPPHTHAHTFHAKSSY